VSATHSFSHNFIGMVYMLSSSQLDPSGVTIATLKVASIKRVSRSVAMLYPVYSYALFMEICQFHLLCARGGGVL